MPNDSSTGGYLSPQSPAPDDDIDLDALIQPVIVGITGLADAMVLIRGQAIPPQQPGREQTWCSFAVIDTESDTFPAVTHDSSGEGADTIYRHENLRVMASFYGPAARGNAALLRDGFNIAQNREAMQTAGLAYVGAERMTFVPDFENTQFIRRIDFVFNLRRVVARTYPVRNLLSAGGTIHGDIDQRDEPWSTP